MKKLALSVAVLALTAGGAFAADLPSRKGPAILPPPPPPPPMWTGFYAGLNAGYGFGTNSNTQTATLGQGVPFTAWDVTDGEISRRTATTLGSGLALSGVGPMTQNGFIGGGQVGYNFQWGQSFVIGIEADIQGSGIRGSSTAIGVGSESVLNYLDGTSYHENIDTTSIGRSNVQAGVDWMGTVRGRIGYLVTPTLLAYATGGLTYGGAWAQVNQTAFASSTNPYYYSTGETGIYNGYNATHTFVGGGQQAKTLVGWNVGGGLEWMFMPNWSLKAEAIYWNMGNMNVAHVAAAAAPGVNNNIDPNNLVSFPEVGNASAVAIGATRVNYQGVIARAGVNYHFNWFAPAPVMASY